MLPNSWPARRVGQASRQLKEPSYACQPKGKVGVGGLAGKAPAWLVGTTVLRPAPPAGGPMPERARAYDWRRHPLAHLCELIGSWTGRDARWADHVPRGQVPPQAGPAHRAAAGRRSGPRPGLACTGPPARERKKDRKRRREPLERQAVPDRRLCRGALLWQGKGSKSKGPASGFRTRR